MNVENIENKKKRITMRGTHVSTFDGKTGRMSIPAKLRDALSDGFYIAKHDDSDIVCLKVYTEAAWETFEDDVHEKVISIAERDRVIRDMDCYDDTLDKQGRFTVPESLRKYAELKGELVVVGMGNTAEIWSKERFDRRYDGQNLPEDMVKAAEILRKSGM